MLGTALPLVAAAARVSPSPFHVFFPGCAASAQGEHRSRPFLTRRAAAEGEQWRFCEFHQRVSGVYGQDYLCPPLIAVLPSGARNAYNGAISFRGGIIFNLKVAYT